MSLLADDIIGFNGPAMTKSDHILLREIMYFTLLRWKCGRNAGNLVDLKGEVIHQQIGNAVSKESGLE